MNELKKLLRPSLVVTTLTLVMTLALFAGCGGGTKPAPVAANPSPGSSRSPTPTSSTPSNAQVVPDIQKLTGWQTCVLSCAGSPAAVFSMTQGIRPPPPPA